MSEHDRPTAPPTFAPGPAIPPRPRRKVQQHTVGAATPDPAGAAPATAPALRADPDAPRYPTPFDIEKPNFYELDRAFRDLSCFEPRRLEIAEVCAKALNTDVSEFAFTDATMQFHLLTQLVAAGEWLGDGLARLDGVGAGEGDRETDRWIRGAFVETVAGALTRLVLHPALQGPLDPGSMEATTAMLFAQRALAQHPEQAASRGRGFSSLLSYWNACTTLLCGGMMQYAKTGELPALRLDPIDAIEQQLLAPVFGGDENAGAPLAAAARQAMGMLWAQIAFVLSPPEDCPIRATVVIDPTHGRAQAGSAIKRALAIYGLYRRPMEVVADPATGRRTLAPTNATFAAVAEGFGTPSARVVLDDCRTTTAGAWSPGEPLALVAFQPADPRASWRQHGLLDAVAQFVEGYRAGGSRATVEAVAESPAPLAAEGRAPGSALAAMRALAREVGAAVEAAGENADKELLDSARQLQEALSALAQAEGATPGNASPKAAAPAPARLANEGREEAPLYPTPFDPEEPDLTAPDRVFLDLSYFEPRRLEIAAACAQALNIDVSEFEFTPDNLEFHFLSQLIAVGEWVGDRLQDTAWAGRDETDEDWRDGDARWTHQAFAQLLAGLIARLLLHPVYMGPVKPGSDEAQAVQFFLNEALRECPEAEAEQRALGASTVLGCWSAATQGLMRGLRVHAESGARPIGVRLDELDSIESQLVDAFFGDPEDEAFPFEAVRHAVAMLWAEAHHLFESSENGPFRAQLQLNPEHPDVEMLSTFKRFLGVYGFHRRPMELVRDRNTGALALAPFDGSFGELARGAGTPQARFVMEACRTRTMGRWQPGDAVDFLIFQSTSARARASRWEATASVLHAVGAFTRQQAEEGPKTKIVFFGQALL